MLADYDDIRKRIKEEPIWYDTNGVPRYDKFEPMLCSNIYATEIVLLKIACQSCGQKFLVEMHYSMMDRVNGIKPLSKKLRNLHYGDPPIHGCCGDTMNCDDIRIVEFGVRKDLIGNE